MMLLAVATSAFGIRTGDNATWLSCVLFLFFATHAFALRTLHEIIEQQRQQIATLRAERLNGDRDSGANP